MLARLSLQLLVSSVLAEVYVYQPQARGKYFTNTEGLASVPVHFDVFGGSPSSQGCLELSKVASDTKVLFAKTCVEASQFNLNQIPPGRYQLTLSEPGMENVKELEFEVQRFEEAVPLIRFPTLSSDAVTVALPQGSHEAPSMSLRYELIEAGIPLNRFRVCVATQDAREAQRPVCFPFNSNELLLSHLHQGSHLLTFEVSLAQQPFTVFPHTRREVEIRVLPLQELLPEIVLESPDELDYMVKTVDDIAMVDLNFDLVGAPSAVQQVRVCVLVDDLSEGTSVLQLTCLPPNDRSLHLYNMRMGSYMVKLMLKSSNEPSSLFDSTLRAIPLEIRLPEEFVPSYDWQELKAWHTVPTGLEIRSIMKKMLI